MVSDDKCLDLSVIPQFGGTCWFNAILMIALYSQNVRKVLMKYSKKWDKTNSFLMILKRILFTYYKHPDKVQEFFNKIRPETILLKMLKKFNDNEMIDYFKNNLKYKLAFGFNSGYIIRFLKYIGINTLDVVYTSKNGYYLNIDNQIKYIADEKTNNIYFKLNNNISENKIKEIFNQTSKILEKKPDIIILKHEDLNIPQPLKELYDISAKIFHEFKSSQYKFDVKGLDKYQDIIYLNGHKYKLDAVTLSNYDKDKGGHAIAGITCNGNRYVYNGWNSMSTDPALKDKNKGLTSPCSLMKYDWNLRKSGDFCLNPVTCKLDFFNPLKNKSKSLCFSFARGERNLVYVRIDNDNISNENNLSHTPQFSDMSNIIKDMFSINKLTDEELRIALKKIYKNYKLLSFDKYNTQALQKIYYDAIVNMYNLTPKKHKKVVDKKPLLKKDILNAVRAKYPHMKNLNAKTKVELLAILNGHKAH